MAFEPLRFRVALLGCLLALALAGCDRGSLLVPGLKLPPGSKVVRESRHYDYDLARPEARQGRLVSIAIEFDCPGGWETAGPYFENELGRRGFKTTGVMAQAAQAAGKAGESPEQSEAGGLPRHVDAEAEPDSPEASLTAVASLMPSYESKDGKVSVELMDMAGLGANYPTAAPGAISINVRLRK